VRVEPGWIAAARGCAYLALAGCALAAGLACWEVRTFLRVTPRWIRAELQVTREALLHELRQSRAELLNRADRIERRTVGQLEQARADLMRESAAYRADGNRHLDRWAEMAAAELRQVTGSLDRLASAYAALPADFKYATAQIWDCQHNPDCLENRYVSLSRALERASREVELAAPRVAASLEQTAANSRQTTAHSAQFMRNLAESFKPLPRWVRIPLQIAAPAAQVALPFAVR
jgi:chromosome segregation ATPase